MEKIQIHEIIKNSSLKELKKEPNTESISKVFQISNNKVLKLFNPNILEILKQISIDIEGKILNVEKFNLPTEIIKPEIAVYERQYFVGYIMQKARGIDYNTYDDRLTLEQRKNLQRYAELYSKLERIIKFNNNIIYPDFCTCDNIYIDQNQNIQLIDYDGIQIDNYAVPTISSTLGDISQYMFSKKYRNQEKQLFKKDLDIKSLIYLYFLTTFNIDLNKVGQINPFTRQPISLEEIFNCINLEDVDIMHKVWKIYQENIPNEYLGDDVYKLAENYQIEIHGQSTPNTYLKKLKKHN